MFGRRRSSENRITGAEELKTFIELGSFIEAMLSDEGYIAKSDYLERLSEAKESIDYIGVLEDSGVLGSFCRKKGVKTAAVRKILKRCDDIETLVDKHNEAFIKRALTEEKDYLDNILKESDPSILLDDDQRRVVLTDEDYCLVVAGAGAGKTTTVAAKVKYLVEKKGIDPADILVISFTNKAVNELKQRIIGELHIPCPIATFHSTGNAILRKKEDKKLNIVQPSALYYVVQQYLKQYSLASESTARNLVLFFGSYFDAPYDGEELKDFFKKISKANYTTLRSELNEFEKEVIDRRTKKKVTIQSEEMRSLQEVEIANFLYLNGIDYEYEPIYRYDIKSSRKPYTPDFVIRQDGKEIYIEHFGITEDGRNDRYSSDQLDSYRKAIAEKIRLHKSHGTKLIYTYSSFNDGRTLTDHLKEKLETAGIELRPRPDEEIIRKLIDAEENRYIRKLVGLLTRFIQNFKINGFDETEFARMKDKTPNVRSRLFLDIAKECYLEYQRYLRKNDAVDFEDMINESARILMECESMKKKLSFKYIIVDEYQDISRQRFDLVTALKKVTDAKIIAVGDDWQSIYAFSGSDIRLFTDFINKVGYGKLLKIVRTYRNSQEIIDIAGRFVQRNDAQIKKELVSPKHIKDPVIIYTYDNTPKKWKADRRSGAGYANAYAVQTALDRIVAFNRKEHKDNSSILLLGRYGFDGYNLENSGLFEYIDRGSKVRSVKHPKLDITFMTVHAAKGLGYDNVIVINGKNETYGFPSKIEDDPILNLVLHEDRSIEYAEERRLFYVAMTRTKNRVYFVAPERNPSEFLIEIKQHYRNVALRGEWSESLDELKPFQKQCPVCGYPMAFRYKPAYGLKLHICKNEPEICGFMTNEYGGGDLSILKCDSCRDGYLIVRKSAKNDYFLGCTNYKKDGTGCSRTVSKQEYYRLMDNADRVIPAEAPKKKTITDERHNTEADRENEHLDYLVRSIEQQEKSIEHIIKKEGIKPVMYLGHDIHDAIYIILQCLMEISKDRFYGITILADVLRGSKNKKTMAAGFDKLPHYGGLKYMSREDILIVIDWLINNGYILKTKGRYPVLHPSAKGMRYGETLTDAKLRKLVKMLE